MTAHVGPPETPGGRGDRTVGPGAVTPWAAGVRTLRTGSERWWTGPGRDAAVLALAAAAPPVFVAAAVLARAAQPPGTYDALVQTVSTLAGRGATDRWLMAGALAVLGVVHLLVAVGLRGLPRPARAVLATGAVGVLVLAAAAQPAHGSSPVHMTAMVIATIAYVGWPAVLATDRALAPGLRRDSLVATAVMVVLLGWLCAQAWTDGDRLGLAERVLVLAEMVWPIRMAQAARRRAPAPRPDPVSRLAVVPALLAPAVSVAGLAAAQGAQRGVDPWRMSLSALAAGGATGRAVMTATLVLIALLYVLLALGLRAVPPRPRLVFGVGGAMLLVAALAPQPAGGGTSALHMASAGVAWAALTVWPLLLAATPGVDPRLRRASLVAGGVLLVLLGWFAAQLVTGGTWYGISERVVFAAQCAWPTVVTGVAVLRPALFGPRRRAARVPAA